jgi:uncharacterized protein (UPF0276 family)
MTETLPELGVGIGWRHEIDVTVERLDADFVEFIAEDVNPRRVPESLTLIRGRGTPTLPHAVSLSLGGAEPLEVSRVEHLARVAEAVGAPLVSDHVAFTRASGLDAGHILPLPRTREALDVLVDNVRFAQTYLPVPLALENVAALLEWPDAEFDEAAFLAELVERTGCWLIVDIANLYANAHNIGTDPAKFVDDLPLERIAYVHIGGGIWREGVYHDTHAHPVSPEVLDLLAELRARTRPRGVLLERDDRFPSDAELAAELAEIRRVVSG